MVSAPFATGETFEGGQSGGEGQRSVTTPLSSRLGRDKDLLAKCDTQYVAKAAMTAIKTGTSLVSHRVAALALASDMSPAASPSSSSGRRRLSCRGVQIG